MKKTIIIICWLVALVTSSTNLHALDWSIETLETGPYAGFFVSLDLDSSNNPHITHMYDWGLQYVYRIENQWYKEMLLQRAHRNSLVLDSNDSPHIIYTTGNNLKYTYKDDSTWHTEDIDTDTYHNSFISLALDSSSFPNAAYTADSTKYLKYAFKDTSGWHHEVLNSERSIDVSLVLDSEDNPHIVYKTPDTELTKYAYKNETGWSVGEIIDSFGSQQSGHRPSIAIDNFDNPHIAYFYNTRLKYAYKDITGWHKETVLDESYATVWEISLALDNSDRPHISHCRGAFRHLEYSYKDTSGWHTEVVDPERWTGDSHSSLQVDSMNNIYIAYHRIGPSAQRALKFAYASAPSPPNVPPVANAGPDLTVDVGINCFATVVLDGSDSTDSDSSPGTNDDIVSFDWYNGDTYLGSGEIMNYSFAPGRYVITLRVTDSFGEIDEDAMIIIVQDTTPPDLSVLVSPDTLWPPNHNMVPVSATVSVSDNCDPNPTVVLVSAVSSEPDNATGEGDGNTTNDIQGADVGTEDYDISLRAERQGAGSGRIYTVTFEATDDSGNSVTASSNVLVPHEAG